MQPFFPAAGMGIKLANGQRVANKYRVIFRQLINDCGNVLNSISRSRTFFKLNKNTLPTKWARLRQSGHQRSTKSRWICTQHMGNPLRRITPARPGLDNDLHACAGSIVLQIPGDRKSTETQNPLRAYSGIQGRITQPSVVSHRHVRPVMWAETKIGQRFGKNGAIQLGSQRTNSLWKIDIFRQFTANNNPRSPGNCPTNRLNIIWRQAEQWLVNMNFGRHIASRHVALRNQRFAKGLVDMHRPRMRPACLLTNPRRQSMQPCRIKSLMRRTQRVTGTHLRSKQIDLINRLVGTASLQLRRAISRNQN